MQNLEEKNESEFMTLATRAAEYQRPSIDPTHAPTASPTERRESDKLPKRNTVYLKCKDHCVKTKDKFWTEENTSCLSCLKYDVCNNFRNGVLPREKEVLEYLLTLKSQQTGVAGDKCRMVAIDLKLHWIYCNVYPIDITAIKNRVQCRYYLQ